ncbi:related to DOA1-involved in ubiquitin-dependent proteolysis [Sporisorium reilianum f. sp. reilianum]|uniref:Related to DOA1-involved in ubiquitin-dependent proteolysis n=1 Tax=Sporisorium reilianum f. sp. reilianum TaxID=72559 RepID=A0A2N8ULV5_9BASI|nr:related to DOA1-involved in ubiquitin-dependent proteolysis [Sporisorium reilianum f. sp. reilianum]
MSQGTVDASASTDNADHASKSATDNKDFVLTHVLRGHTSDVRSVAATFDELSQREALLSGSRDETATFWSRPCAAPSDAPPSFDKGVTFHGQRFCNAVVFVPPAPSFGLPRGQILMGGLDSQIRCFDPLRADKPLQVLSDHWDNISVLSSHTGSPAQQEAPSFISASWDKTARVWTWHPVDAKWSTKFVLRGHDEAVWGVQIVEPPSSAEAAEPSQQGRYLTSSADLFIRLFHGEQLTAVYAGHMDVVRSLRLLPALPSSATTATGDQPAYYPNEQLFASTSNDGTVRIWSLDARRSPTRGNGGEALRVLRGHTSLVYDVAAYIGRVTANPRLVSSGEDGSFRVWDWNSGELLQTVAVPVVSVWSIAVLPQSQDVVVGCSDGLVRVYSQHPPSTVPASDSNFLGAALSESEAAIEAHQAQEVQQRHTLSIQAKEASTSSEDQGEGELYQGQRYDFVLRIDVSDDTEPLPLPINRADDRKQIASDFVKLHHLPESYVDKIVDFVNLVLG